MMDGDSLYFALRVLFTVALLATLVLIIRASLFDIAEVDPSGQSSKPAKQRSELVVTESAASELPAGTHFSLYDSASIGRDPQMDVCLDDPSVSAQHAEIVFANNGWVVRDLGSRNGTFVNGQDVRLDVALVSGDFIAFGRVETRFVC